MPKEIKLFYTKELDFQIKKSEYVIANDINNSYTILLNKLVPMQENIGFTKNIPIDVINSDAGYDIEVEPEIEKKKYFKNKIITKPFEFKIKGE